MAPGNSEDGPELGGVAAGSKARTHAQPRKDRCR